MNSSKESSHDAILPPNAGTPAAEYVRMSTDHQQYSTANQSQAIREYAVRHGFNIERTYIDSGKSGLSLDDRDALKQLIDDVQNGTAAYSTILVYDVNRPAIHLVSRNRS
jgi:DNA invertase Pin-like site-specific DNA recombinase